MNRLLFAILTAVAFSASASEDNLLNSIKPEPVNPNAAPTAVAWQAKNEKALAAATSCKSIAAAVKDAASAKALLAEVKGAYLTAPIIATRISSVSQYVMKDGCRCAGRCKEREIWTSALLDAIRDAKDAYVAQFCIDQLRWCGYASQAKLVREAAKGKSPEVVSIAEMAAKELEGKAVGM